MKQATIDCMRAFQSVAFPSNPRPFAAALADLLAERGASAIKSDDAKAILWILNCQAYGQLSTIDLCAEWDRLNAAACMQAEELAGMVPS